MKLGMGTNVTAPSGFSSAELSVAIELALRSGIRSFDTAHNYCSGEAEVALGESFRRFAKDGIDVHTKVGFVDAPPNLDGPQLVSYLEDRYHSLSEVPSGALVLGRHCLDRRFIAECLETSVTRLNGIHLRRVLVHNPETQLLECTREEFERRLTDAFDVLEQSVRRGKIGGYGVATWMALLVEPDHDYHVSLESMVDLARRVGGSRHGFRTVMFPLNPSLPDAVLHNSQIVGGSNLSALEAAKRLGLEVHVASPFGQGPRSQEAKRACAELLPLMCSEPSIDRVFATMWASRHLAENIRISSATPSTNLREWLSLHMSDCPES